MTDDDGFIGLPPGVVPNADSGTLRRDRTERPRGKRDEIAFFPGAPGSAPPAPTVKPAPKVKPAAPPATVDETAHPDAVPTETSGAETVVEVPAPRPGIDDATVVKSSRRAAPTWRLVIGGLQTTVEGMLYLGRKPVAGPTHPHAQLLMVDDEARSVSKTHAMLELDSGALWVHDLHSTNGVWVVPAGEDPIEVVPGERVKVPAGSELELGEFVIQIEHG